MNATMPKTINDQIIAIDLLIASKEAVKCTARALTEAASPNVRSVLKQQLDSAITFHEQISAYTMNAGIYNPYNITEQMRKDMQQAQQTMGLQM